VAVAFNLPLLLLMLGLRRRLPRQVCGALVAAGFAYGVTNNIAVIAVDTADNESAPGTITVAS
jgi:hypothetical protein